MGKVQVCKMAKDLNVPAKDLVTMFQDIGVPVKNHLAWVEDEEADQVKKKLLEPKPEPAAPAPAPAASRPAAPAQASTMAPAGGRPAGATSPVNVPPRRPEPTAVPQRPSPTAVPPRRPDAPGMAPRRPDGSPMPRRPEGAPPRPGEAARAPGGPARPGAPGKPGAPGWRERKDDKEKELTVKQKPRRKSKAEIREERRARKLGRVVKEEIPTSIDLVGPLTVKELADKMKVKETEVIKRLFMKGIIATINQTIEKETAEMIAVEMEYEVNLIDPLAQSLAAVDEVDANEPGLLPRPPIVTVMGHVDHGKTSLLDAVRETRVASGEAGGITQHIGAYMAEVHGQEICFLDTPGHEAFTAMRARGAKATDIAILVVAADDGVMPQTEEAIQHAQAANVPIIVAINKIDKAGANPDRVKQELTEFNLVPEDWGGTTIMVEVSAKQRLNLDTLLEMVLLQAEVMELKANPDKDARGMIIEAKLSKGMGPVATVLVQSGTLKVGDPFVVGALHGKVRALINDLGKRVKEAGPAHPVEVLGLPDVPRAGDIFQVMGSDREAKQLAETRAVAERERQLSQRNKLTLQNFYSRIQEGQKELPIIIKADVKGSSEAIEQALSQLNEKTEGSTLRVLLSGNGDVSETDINLAAASEALVIAFNVKVDDRASRAAEEANVDVRSYDIIYKMVEDLEKALLGLLEPEYEQVLVGKAEVRAVFKVGKTGVIAGCMVTEGKIVRNAELKIYRGKDMVYEGKLDSLKRFKDDVKEVATGYECGISLDKFNAFEEGDVVEAYVTQEKGR